MPEKSSEFTEKTQPPKRPVRRAAKVIGSVAFCATVGLGINLSCAKETASVGVSDAEISAGLDLSGKGGTNVDLGPLGQASIPTHEGPVTNNIRLKSTNASAWQDLDDPEEVERIIQEGGDNLGEAQSDLVKKTMLFWTIGAGSAALVGSMFADRKLIPKRRTLSHWGSAFVVSLAIPVGVGVHMQNSTKESGIEDAVLTGPISEIPQLESSITDIGKNIDTYNNQIAEAITLASSLMNDFESMELLPDSKNMAKFLVVSDIGSDVSSINQIQDLDEWADPDAIFDVTDQTEFGTVFEASLYDRIGKIDTPYIVVRGNHDSEASTDRIAENENVTVLDSEMIKINVINIYGVEDPRFTVGQNRSLKNREEVSEDDKELMTNLGQETLNEIQDEEVDILLMPDEHSANVVNGHVNTTIFAHTHEQVIEFNEDGSAKLNSGALGGESLRPKDSKTPERTAMVIYVNKETKKVSNIVTINFGKSGEYKLHIESCTVQQVEIPKSEPKVECV